MSSLGNTQVMLAAAAAIRQDPKAIAALDSLDEPQQAPQHQKNSNSYFEGPRILQQQEQPQPNPTKSTASSDSKSNSKVRPSRMSTKKGSWDVREDELLRKYCMIELDIARRLCKRVNWKNVAQYIPDRSSKQARERWVNHLNPGVKKAPWTLEEDNLLVTLEEKFPSKWAKISRYMSGRTENSVKVRWKTLERNATKTKANESHEANEPDSVKLPGSADRFGYHGSMSKSTGRGEERGGGSEELRHEHLAKFASLNPGSIECECRATGRVDLKEAVKHVNRKRKRLKKSRQSAHDRLIVSNTSDDNLNRNGSKKRALSGSSRAETFDELFDEGHCTIHKKATSIDSASTSISDTTSASASSSGNIICQEQHPRKKKKKKKVTEKGKLNLDKNKYVSSSSSSNNTPRSPLPTSSASSSMPQGQLPRYREHQQLPMTLAEEESTMRKLAADHQQLQQHQRQQLFSFSPRDQLDYPLSHMSPQHHHLLQQLSPQHRLNLYQQMTSPQHHHYRPPHLGIEFPSPFPRYPHPHDLLMPPFGCPPIGGILGESFGTSPILSPSTQQRALKYRVAHPTSSGGLAHEQYQRRHQSQKDNGQSEIHTAQPDSPHPLVTYLLDLAELVREATSNDSECFKAHSHTTINDKSCASSSSSSASTNGHDSRPQLSPLLSTSKQSPSGMDFRGFTPQYEAPTLSAAEMIHRHFQRSPFGDSVAETGRRDGGAGDMLRARQPSLRRLEVEAEDVRGNMPDEAQCSPIESKNSDHISNIL